MHVNLNYILDYNDLFNYFERSTDKSTRIAFLKDGPFSFEWGCCSPQSIPAHKRDSNRLYLRV